LIAPASVTTTVAGLIEPCASPVRCRFSSASDTSRPASRLLPGQRPGTEHALQRPAPGPLPDAVRDTVVDVAVQHPQEAGVGHRGRPAGGVEESGGPGSSVGSTSTTTARLSTSSTARQTRAPSISASSSAIR
jgi:hypothetical protein